MERETLLWASWAVSWICGFVTAWNLKAIAEALWS